MSHLLEIIVSILYMFIVMIHKHFLRSLGNIFKLNMKYMYMCSAHSRNRYNLLHLPKVGSIPELSMCKVGMEQSKNLLFTLCKVGILDKVGILSPLSVLSHNNQTTPCLSSDFSFCHLSALFWSNADIAYFCSNFAKCCIICLCFMKFQN